jgi:hypothetical protein
MAISTSLLQPFRGRDERAGTRVLQTSRGGERFDTLVS